DRPARRGIPSRVYNSLVRLFLRSRIRDHQCGFKAMDRAAFQQLRTEVSDEHWFWDTELLVRAQRAGLRVAEFPVDWTPQGDSKVDLVRDVVGMGGGIVRTWWHLTIRPRLTRRVSLVAGLVLVLVAVALMTLYLDPAVVIAELVAADLRLVGLGAAIYLVSWPLRGLRYRDILNRLGHYERPGFLTGAIFISQTGNLVFPARAGDAVRAYVLKARRSIPYTAGFASLAIERVFDLLTIAALAGSVLVGLSVTGSTAAIREGLTEAGLATSRSGRTALLVAAAVGLAALIAVAVIVVSARSERNRIRAAINRVSSDAYADRLAGVLERFAADVQTVATDRRAFARIGATSIAIWSLDVVTAVLVLLAFDTGVSVPSLFIVGLFAVSVGNLAKVLPLSPGGIGLYEGAFTVLVVGLTPIGAGTALAAAIVDHAVKNVVTIVGGLVAMAALNVSLTTAVREGADVETPQHD
ncbi:MAG: flippase-like domain-containing protein, partial [Salinirussus sp.]